MTDEVPSVFIIPVKGEEETWYVRFEADGTVTWSDNYHPTPAAESFWRDIAQFNPLRAEVEELRAYVGRVWRTIEAVMHAWAWADTDLAASDTILRRALQKLKEEGHGEAGEAVAYAAEEYSRLRAIRIFAQQVIAQEEIQAWLALTEQDEALFSLENLKQCLSAFDAFEEGSRKDRSHGK